MKGSFKIEKTKDRILECSLEDIPSIEIDRRLFLIVKGRYLRSIRHSESEYTVLIHSKKNKLPMIYHGNLKEEPGVGQPVEIFGKIVKVKGKRKFLCYTIL